MALTDIQLKQISLASLTRKVLEAKTKTLKPPPKLTLSEWATTEFVLSAEASAEPGHYSYDRAPYQKDMLDACSDVEHDEVVFATSAQIGKTTILLALLLYYMKNEPAPILMVQPTKELASSFSKDRLAPALRDCKALNGVVSDAKSRDGANTILAKSFPGGVCNLVGSNAPSSLASRPVRVVLADEVDRYPPSAGTEGDPLQLAIKRTATFYNRKIIIVSTPTDKLTSRIWARYEASDKRQYSIQCVHCNDYFLPVWELVKWNKDADGNHLPETAMLHCPHCGAGHNDTQRNAAVMKGKWNITNPSSRTAGFHLNALISPWSELEKLVVDWLTCQKDMQRLKTFFNTVLGLPWEDRSDNIDDLDLSARVEEYDVDSIPEGVGLLTAGCDVQGDRIEASIYGYGESNEIWHIDHQIFNGNPANPQTWLALEAYLKTKFKREDGVKLPVAAACIDSGGHFTQECYAFAKKHSQRRWWAIKGSNGNKPIFPARASYGKNEGKVYVIGVDSAKEAIYAWLKNSVAGAGYVHFSNRCDTEFFNQLAAEQKVLMYKGGYTFYAWRKDPNRRNEALDCFVYSLAAREGLNVNIKTIKKNIKAKHEKSLQEAAKAAEEAADTTSPIPTETPSLNNNDTAVEKVPAWRKNLKRGSSKWTTL